MSSDPFEFVATSPNTHTLSESKLNVIETLYSNKIFKLNSTSIDIEGLLFDNGTINGVNFNTLTTNVTSLNNEVDLINTKIDSYPSNLDDLTVSIITQLLNIGTLTIGSNEWNNLIALNQALSTTSTVTFANLTVDNLTVNTSSNISSSGSIANYSITNQKMVLKTLQGGSIADNTLTGAHIQASSVPGDRIEYGTFNGASIAPNTITNQQFASKTILGGSIADNTLTGSHIQASSVPGDRIEYGTLNGGVIQENSIPGSRVADGSLDGSKMNSRMVYTDVVVNQKIGVGVDYPQEAVETTGNVKATNFLKNDGSQFVGGITTFQIISAQVQHSLDGSGNPTGTTEALSNYGFNSVYAYITNLSFFGSSGYVYFFGISKNSTIINVQITLSSAGVESVVPRYHIIDNTWGKELRVAMMKSDGTVDTDKHDFSIMAFQL